MKPQELEALIKEPDLTTELKNTPLGTLIREMHLIYAQTPEVINTGAKCSKTNISSYVRYEAIRRELNRRERAEYAPYDDGK